jgi:hypothetical protein
VLLGNLSSSRKISVSGPILVYISVFLFNSCIFVHFSHSVALMALVSYSAGGFFLALLC